MQSTRQGSIHLFRIAGIDLFLHWSWFLVAAYEIQIGRGRYTSLTWNVLEYLALFLIVLLHEFGHALACRQVGGTANQIMLWPLGGVAYVNPPQRPGATLWSIAAGPLVNVALLPLLMGALRLARSMDVAAGMPNLFSLLWFVLGRARSLMVATVLGLVGIAGFIAFAVSKQSVWYIAISVFMLMNC